MVFKDPHLRDLLEDLEESEGISPGTKPKSITPQSSVRLDPDRCVGCAACMRVCPTEAIRIRNGKAVIKYNLCIDCGECVRVCEHKAWILLADPISTIHDFDYRIAVPEPAIYGQFLPGVLPNDILAGILDLGFHEVHEAALGTELSSHLLRLYLNQYQGPKPLITSFCPVGVRLIQLRFPELIEHVVPVDSTLEIAVKELKESRSKELGIPMERIGAFFLAGCPARITTIHFPYTGGKTHLDGALSIGDIYRDLMFAIQARHKTGEKPPQLQKSSGTGIRWGTLGGEVELLGVDNSIAVSDIKHLTRVLQEIDNRKLVDIEFVECRACYAGCAGGPLMVDNPYGGRAKIQMIARRFTRDLYVDESALRDSFARFKPYFDRRLEPLEREGLDPDPSRAIEKLAKKAEIFQSLPGIDCGSCGAPNCKALADDIIRGEANIMYCLFKLRDAFLSQKKRRSKNVSPSK
jgi:ferredoxin